MAIALDANLGTNNSTSAMPSLVTGAAAASNSRIALFVTYYSDTAYITSMSATGGLTWVNEGQHKHPDNGWRVTVLTADAPSGLAGSTTLTPVASGAINGAISAYSFTGLATGASGYLTGTPATSGAYDTSWATGNVTTVDADAILLCAHSGIASATQSNTITGPATELHDIGVAGDGNPAMVTAYRILSSTGTYSIAGTSAVSVYMELDVILAIKAGAVASQILRPDADTDVAGWVTSPLFSKINDVSDSTFVTDGLV